MNIPKKTILTALAGLGAGALSTYLNHQQKNGRFGSTNGRFSSDGFDLSTLLEAATKSGSAYLGGQALSKYMGIGSAVGEKLAAAYLAGKAAKATANEAGESLYEESSNRAGDAYRVLRGRPTRHAEREQDDDVSPLLVAAGVVGFGAALAAVLHKSGALGGDTIKQSASTAKRWAGLDQPSDDELTERIRQEIDGTSGVSFIVEEGIVTVRGSVPDFQREDLLKRIRAVDGVISVEDHLSRD